MYKEIQRKKEEQGFTLIELLIVIIILGILAAIVVFAVGGITDKGDKSACKADVKTVETSIEAYRAAKDAYPSAADPATPVPGDGIDDLKPEFIRSWPNGDKYTITLEANGVISVDAGGADSPAADATACNDLG